MHTGRHFLQIPGPTNVPDRVLRAMAQPVMDHRGPEFAKLSKEALQGIRRVFQTSAERSAALEPGLAGWPQGCLR